MSPIALLLMFLLVFLGSAIITRIPVAFAIGFGTFAIMMLKGSPILGFAQPIYTTLDSFPLLSMPYFIFAGAIMQYSGISDSLIRLVDSAVGRIRGNLGAVTVLASMAFGVLTGSTAATLTAIGGMMISPMLERGYSRSYCAALISASSFLGVLIPPSIPGILFALAANEKISEIWIATIGPGFLLGGLYIAINYFKRKRMEEKNVDPLILKEYFRSVAVQTKNAFWALLMPIIIFGGIYGGICTPTEAGAVSVLYGLLYFIVKKVVLKRKMENTLWNISVSSACTTASCGIIMCISAAAGRAISMTGIAVSLTGFITTHIESPTVFFAFLLVLLLFVGTFLDHTASILILTPLLLPTVKAMGINGVHFGAIVMVTLCVGLITPPYAASLFIGTKITEARFSDVCKEIWPFVAAGVVTAIATTFWPPLSLFMVNLTK
ncbi:TRAP transporter large permease [Synergistaceae bacterium OttesenSCG-928-I11]|nr:TRAP transporter large permease [Synergistaceae bacterium OttesenSCG-928-I11]